MKKALPYLLFMFFFFSHCTMYGQTKRKLVPKELSIGDRLPDMIFKNVINYDKDQLRFSEFGNKAILLDFWAPWCSPCIALLPKLDTLQKKFAKDFQVLAVTKEGRAFSQRLLNNVRQLKKINVPVSIVEDTILSLFFRHKVIPHYIWIGADGIIKAITGSEEISEQNIRKLIDNKELSLAVKRDRVKFDDDKPYFASYQVEASEDLLYHSLITGYIQGAPSTSRFRKTFISCPNHYVKRLYQLAFGKFNIHYLNDNRLMLEGFDRNDSIMVGMWTPETRAIWKEMRTNYLYSYELVVPDTSYIADQKFEIMQQDLNRFFASKGIRGRLEIKLQKVLALQRTSTEDKLKTKGGGPAKDNYSNYYLDIKNNPLKTFLVKLQAFFTTSGVLPIVDETNYREKVDMEINADLTNIDAVNNELEKYDLKLVEKDKEIGVIILSKIRK